MTTIYDAALAKGYLEGITTSLGETCGVPAAIDSVARGALALDLPHQRGYYAGIVAMLVGVSLAPVDRPYYVEIVGSYDAINVGPFYSKAEADSFAELVRGRFDRNVITEEEKQAKAAEFGVIPLQSPPDFIEEMDQ